MSGNTDRTKNQGYDRKAEKAAQERARIPIDKAGRDHIQRRQTNWKAYWEGMDALFGKKNKLTKKETDNG